MKEPFIKTVKEIDTEINLLKQRYATAEARSKRRPRIRSNPPPAIVMIRIQEKITELEKQKNGTME